MALGGGKHRLPPEFVRLLGHVASSGDVALEWVLPPDKDLRRHTDPHRPPQVVLNLAHNGITFTAGHGRRVGIALSTGAEAVEVIVDDEGPGIPPGRLPSLLRGFEQGWVPEAPCDRGVGLGLAVARQRFLQDEERARRPARVS